MGFLCVLANRFEGIRPQSSQHHRAGEIGHNIPGLDCTIRLFGRAAGEIRRAHHYTQMVAELARPRINLGSLVAIQTFNISLLGKHSLGFLFMYPS